MTVKRDVTVELYCGRPDTYSLKELIEFLQAQLDKIPEEFADKAHVGIECRQDYGDYYAEMEITYRRPETDKEFGDRIAREMLSQARREQEEKAQLAYLQKKYEGKQ